MEDAQLLETLAAAKDADVRRSIAQRYVQELFAAHTQATVKWRISKARKLLKDSGADDSVLATEAKGGVTPNTLYSDINEAYKERQWETHNQLEELDVELFIRAGLAALRTDNVFAKAAGLAALTGRRPSEILLLGTFTKADGNSVLFSGQAKTRDADGTAFSYRIPTLCSGKEAIAALAYIRENYDVQDLTAEEVSKRASKTLGQYIGRAFGQHFKAQRLRAAYSAVAYHLHGRSRHTSPVAYASKILGHKLLGKDTAGGDLETPLSYMKFSIKDGWTPRTAHLIPESALAEIDAAGETPPEATPTAPNTQTTEGTQNMSQETAPEQTTPAATKRLDAKLPEDLHAHIVSLRDKLGLTNTELLTLLVDACPSTKEEMELINNAAASTTFSRREIMLNGSLATARRVLNTNKDNPLDAAITEAYDLCRKKGLKADHITLSLINNLTGRNKDTVARILTNTNRPFGAGRDRMAESANRPIIADIAREWQERQATQDKSGESTSTEESAPSEEPEPAKAKEAPSVTPSAPKAAPAPKKIAFVPSPTHGRQGGRPLTR